MTNKVETYRQALRKLESWDAYLLQESRLPGPRANLELAFAVAAEGSEALFLRYAALGPAAAPTHSSTEFLAFCGVLGLGYLAARGAGQHFDRLRQAASDPRWRIREAVALGLQQFGRSDMETLLDLMQDWSQGNPLERRAVVATLCEPGLLAQDEHARRILDLLDAITASLLEEQDRRSEALRVLRKGLAYGWSVAVAAQPAMGKPCMEGWVATDDQDIRWLMRQNLKKKRLLKMDATWVQAQLAALE